MHEFLVEMLECPVCHGGLTWRVTSRHGEQIEEGQVVCAGCGATYPIREGIGVFLTPDLPRNDLWERVESGLAAYLRQNPEVERALLAGPAEALGPADRFFRSMVLEERSEYAEARRLAQEAFPEIYTREYLDCSQREVDYLVRRLQSGSGPIVDLASGRGVLAEALADRLDRPIVMTDFSLTVLRRDRRMFEMIGLLGRVSLLAFDARRTPFKDASVATMTSYVGLPNIEEPGSVLFELRRIVGGEFLALTHFYPEGDEAHWQVLAGDSLLYRDPTLRQLEAAGWEVTVRNVCHGRAEPTPSGVVLEGLGIDGLPIAETVLEWCVLEAR
jgi:uncharacterized protein YbaR (Trm112 family)